MSWLGTWAKRVKVTADGGDITANLTWFPILIHLSASCGISSQDLSLIFDDLGVNNKKIAVTLSDGVTQCYVEIDTWNAASEEAFLWVSLTGWTLNSGVDEEFYLYFDPAQLDNDTYVGLPNSVPAEQVWDASFVLVSHMQDDPDTSHIRDSTGNDNDGTKKDVNEPLETVSGKIGDAQDFDALNDYITITYNATLDVAALTISAYINHNDTEGVSKKEIFLKDYTFASNVYPFYFYINRFTGTLVFGLFDGVGNRIVTSTLAVTAGVLTHVAVTFTRPTVHIYIDGVDDGAQTLDFALPTNNSFATIGSGTVNGWAFSDVIDEVHFSNIARAQAWMTTEYETERDHFLSYGNPEIFSSARLILSHHRIIRGI